MLIKTFKRACAALVLAGLAGTASGEQVLVDEAERSGTTKGAMIGDPKAPIVIWQPGSNPDSSAVEDPNTEFEDAVRLSDGTIVIWSRKNGRLETIDYRTLSENFVIREEPMSTPDELRFYDGTGNNALVVEGRMDIKANENEPGYTCQKAGAPVNGRTVQRPDMKWGQLWRCTFKRLFQPVGCREVKQWRRCNGYNHAEVEYEQVGPEIPGLDPYCLSAGDVSCELIPLSVSGQSCKLVSGLQWARNGNHCELAPQSFGGEIAHGQCGTIYSRNSSTAVTACCANGRLVERGDITEDSPPPLCPADSTVECPTQNFNCGGQSMSLPAGNSGETANCANFQNVLLSCNWATASATCTPAGWQVSGCTSGTGVVNTGNCALQRGCVKNGSPGAGVTCAAGTYRWDQSVPLESATGSSRCSASVPVSTDTTELVVTNSASGMSGSTTMQCVNGLWRTKPGTTPSCTSQGQTSCEAVARQNFGNGCYGALGAASNDESRTVVNTALGFSGLAEYRCVNGSWTSLGGASCDPQAVSQCSQASRICQGSTFDLQPLPHEYRWICQDRRPNLFNCRIDNATYRCDPGQGFVQTACTTATFGNLTANCTGALEAGCVVAGPTANVNGPRCGAGTLSWNGGQCGAAVPGGADGTTWVADNTQSGLAGRNRFTCSNGIWSQDPTYTPTCSQPVEQDCSETSGSWTVNGNTCSGGIEEALAGGTSTATDATAPTVGQASFRCTAGAFQLQPGATCGLDTSSCGTAPQSWGDGCGAGMSSTVNGGALLVQNTAANREGSANYRCNNGTWVLQPGASCRRTCSGTSLTCGDAIYTLPKTEVGSSFTCRDGTTRTVLLLPTYQVHTGTPACAASGWQNLSCTSANATKAAHDAANNAGCIRN